MPFRYSASGLSLSSEIALPGLFQPGVDHDPDVRIRLGSVPTTLPHATASGPTWQIAGDHFLFHVPGVARFLLDSGQSVTIERLGDASSSDIALFLLGSVLGILLHQRERIVLHASSVRVNGKAVIFCGPSGAGKSTMAAALGARGYDLVTDDLCALAMDSSGAPVVYPDGRFLKLWDHTIGNLGLAGRRGDAVRAALQKYYVAPAGAASGPLPLGAIYVLRQARPPYVAGIERENAVDAAVWVKLSAFRPRLVKRMGLNTSYFRAATAIAHQVGVFHLTRPIDFAGLPDVTAWLEQHWSDIGILGPTA